MLNMLKQRHEEVLTLLDALDVQTRFEVPDQAQLGQARWRLRSAQAKGLTLLNEILAKIAPRLDADERQRVQQLQEAERAHSVRVSQLVADWTMQRILSDWRGYQQIAPVLRSEARNLIEAERAALYPILERAEFRLLTP